MDSGAIIPAYTVTSPKAQAVYNTTVINAGCGKMADTLACLRSKDYTTLLNAMNSVPALLGYRSIDLSYLPRPDPGDDFFSQSPELSVSAGNFANVPIIIGDQEDEGTLFSLTQSNITTDDELIRYIASYFPENPTAVSDVTGLVANYADQPSIGQPDGSPFGTGALNNVYPQFKRLAAILGDITFTLSRRIYLNIVSSEVKCWSYLNSYLYGLPVLGTFHGSDILYTYGTLSEALEPTQTIQTYYINFINHLDPNGIINTSALTVWPQYSTKPTLMNFRAASNVLIQDTFRQNAAAYLSGKITNFRV